MALTPKLSILIATMPSRLEQLKRLANVLSPQLRIEAPVEGILGALKSTPNESVEVLFNDSMDYNIGVKRNKLLQEAKGEYIVYIDDDDHISRNYIELILKAIESKPDCIGISGYITTNGGNSKQWHISKEYGSWHEKDNIYYRTPNHISPVRRELALKAAFPPISHGEDYEYSMRLLPLLKTEIIIKENIYHYDFYDKKVHC